MGARWFIGLMVEIVVLVALFICLPLFVYVMGVAQGLAR